MARPFKQGLDYFPVDVTIFQNRKFRRVREKYGHLSVSVYLALLSMIYADQGYYIPYAGIEKENVAYDLIDALRGGDPPDIVTISAIIQALVVADLFDSTCFEKGILTSVRIQATYYTATLSRKKVKVDPSIWLLDEKTMRDLGDRHCLLKEWVNEGKNPIIEANNSVNEANNGVNASNNTQSKVKEKKVKEKKEKHQDAACAAILKLPLKDGDTYGIGAEALAVYADTYPNLNLPAELKKMQCWLMSNPTRLKTRKGITRFINGWLLKADSANTAPAIEANGITVYEGGSSL